MNLLDPFHQHAIKQPESLALSVENKDFTYQDLFHHVRTLATAILATTQKNNPRVGVLAARTLTAYTGIMAASYAGGAYLPINVNNPPEYLHEIIAASSLDVLIIDASGHEILSHNKFQMLPDVILAPFAPCDSESSLSVYDSTRIAQFTPTEKPVQVKTEDYAYVMFTSGTTGKPKGIGVTVGNITHLLTTLQQRYDLNPGDRVSQAFELTFDLSVFDLFMTFRSGASLHVVPEHQMFSPAHFIRRHQLSIWFSVPSVAGMMAQMKLLKQGAFPALRHSLFCGEALPESTVDAWKDAAPNSRIDNLYGPTEATVACLLQSCSDPEAVTPDRGIIAIGKPLDGLYAAITDQDGQFLKPGEKGELVINGPQVTPGYLNNPELTTRQFPILDHPDRGKSQWYRTGDKAYMDIDGRYHFLGRIDNQVKLRGHRVELDEIEHHLREVTGCDVAVVVILDRAEHWAQEIVGVISQGDIDISEIRQQLQNRLPSYMVPKQIVIKNDLPRNASGKIDRKAVRSELAKTLSR